MPTDFEIHTGAASTSLHALHALLSTIHVLSRMILHNKTYHQVILHPFVLGGDLLPAVVCEVEVLRRERHHVHGANVETARTEK